MVLILSSRCNEVTGPDLAPTPLNSTALPVVTSVEQGPWDENTWLIHGINFKPSPIATFESDSSVIPLFITVNPPNGTLLRVVGTTAMKPGTYAPCVRTNYGKGCGSGSSLIIVK